MSRRCGEDESPDILRIRREFRFTLTSNPLKLQNRGLEMRKCIL